MPHFLFFLLFQDAVFKMHGHCPLQKRISQSLQLLHQGAEDMMEHHPTSLPYLEAVAKLRYALSVVAELLYYQQERQTAGQREVGHLYTHEAKLLVEHAKWCCSHSQLNEEEAGPAVYLVKLLARQYGCSFLTNLTANPALTWVVPPQFRQSTEVSITNTQYFKELSSLEVPTITSLVFFFPLRRGSNRLMCLSSTIHFTHNFVSFSLMLHMVIS